MALFEDKNWINNFSYQETRTKSMVEAPVDVSNLTLYSFDVNFSLDKVLSIVKIKSCNLK